jgi:hypothetical protein
MRTVLTKEDIAFENGFRAQENGERMTDNPYPAGSRERTSWFAGYERAQECGGTCSE